MDLLHIESAIEAILFGVGDAVSLEEISNSVEVDIDTTRKIINILADKYNMEKRGVRIIELDGSYQMCSREDYYDYIRKVTEPKRKQALSSAALETLSIIAYNGSITKSKIEQIRGVDCSGSIARLVERGLIDEAGRLDAPGRPILYETTTEFLRCFGLKSLNELPDITSQKEE